MLVCTLTFGQFKLLQQQQVRDVSKSHTANNSTIVHKLHLQQQPKDVSKSHAANGCTIVINYPKSVYFVFGEMNDNFPKCIRWLYATQLQHGINMVHREGYSMFLQTPPQTTTSHTAPSHPSAGQTGSSSHKRKIPQSHSQQYTTIYTPSLKTCYAHPRSLQLLSAAAGTWPR